MINKVKSLFQSKILQASFIYTIGNIFVKGINFISIPIFTRMMTVEDYGLMNNFVSLVSIVTVIVGLSLNGAVANAKFDYDEKFDEFLSSVLFLSTISFLIFLIIGNIFYFFINSFFEINQVVYNYLIFQSFSLFIVQYVCSIFTIKGEALKFLGVSFLSTMINIGFSILFMTTVLNNNLYLGRVIGSTFGLTALALILYSFIIIRGKKKFHPKYWKYALNISLPLIPHQLSTIILSRFDQTMINQVIGPYEAGMYSFILNISVVLSVLWSSTNSAWVPWLYSQLNSNNIDEIRDKTDYYIIGFAGLTILSMILMVDVARLMAGNEYENSLVLMVPIMSSYFFQFLYSLPVNIEFYYKKTNLIAIGTIACAVIKIILNLVTLPIFGYQAAAYTTIFSYILLFVFHYWIYSKISKNKLMNLRMIVLSIVIITFLGMLIQLTLNQIILRYLLFVVLIVSIYFFKERRFN